MEEHLKTIITEYALKRNDKSISQEEFDKLNSILKSDKQAARFYNEVMMALLNFQEFGAEISSANLYEYCDLDSDILQKLAKEEQVAPEVFIDEPKEVVIETSSKIVKEKKPSKFIRFYNIAVSAAAVLFFIFILYVHVFPPQYTVPVAVVIDQIGVTWNSASQALIKNDKVLTNQPPYKLDKGIIKLSYYEGVDVVIEGPAEFKIEHKGISIDYGRLYSYVSNTGRGFTVDTPNNRFIDLGTEFGVFVGQDNSSELHVLKGQVQYYSGLPGSDKISKTLKENSARRFNSDTGDIEVIPVAEEYFAREVDSASGMIWRGRHNLDLASIIAGLDGFQDVDSTIGLNPITGKYDSPFFYEDSKTNNEYSLVYESKFIDGIFVPDGGKDLVTITSTGLKYACPNTGGKYTHNLCVYKGELGEKNSTIIPAVFGGKKLSETFEPLVLMHSNIGITIDLDSIRNEVPKLELDRFTAWGGITEAALDVDGGAPDVSFIVIVDGQVKYEKKNMKIEDGTVSIDLELNAKDRFLTLVVLDALKNPDSRNFPWANDFFYLVSPEIFLSIK